MKLFPTVVRFAPAALFAGLLIAPAAAQTQIGGGACNSGYLKGTFALSLTARQVNSSGTFLGVLQANGTATFDGLSAVTIALTENTNLASSATLNWSGTYSVVSNCTATVNITSGGTATLNVVIYNQGKDFLLAGSDATFSYTGNGVAQSFTPGSTCSAATLNGVYTFNGTGFTLASNAANGVTNGDGLLQFDGQSNVTLTLSTSGKGGAAPQSSTLTGTYTISSTCTGSATLKDSSSNSYAMSLSIYSNNATNTNFYATLTQAGNFLIAGGAHTAYPTAGSGTCSTSTLKGTYALLLSGRSISSAGNFAGSYQGVGTITFDGNGSATLSGTNNTNTAQGTSFTYQASYTLPSSCAGTLSTTINGAANFSLVVWASGTQFDLTGSDSNYTYSASGDSNLLPACATPTLSGEYAFSASGFTQSGLTLQNGAKDESGVLQFDGQGNVTASYTDTQGGITAVTDTGSGTYTVNSSCLGSATLKDPAGVSTALNLVITSQHGENLDLLAANSQYVRTGTAHSAFTNPSQAIVNVASYAYSYTPAGSVFALFGLGLATNKAQALSTPLPTKLLNTTVTVNGELAPLFYVDPNQIDAQMPWDIPGNSVASVIVTNGTSASNAAAVYVPATGTPGISVYSTNHAVVVNANGTVNAGGAGAKVGEEVVAYFTGGGPVPSSCQPATGKVAADQCLVTGSNSVTVDSINAIVDYMGLTPGSIGLYQANFNVPQVAAGAYPVVITIAGQMSNNPVINVSN